MGEHPGTMTASLTTKVLNSLGWVFTNIAAKNGLMFVRTVVLWQLLTAEEFGLNAMAWFAINAFTLLQDAGFANALIHRKKDLAEAISVTWYANVAIRVVVYAILYVSAPLFAANFGQPEVTSILRVASIALVMGSFGNANEALLRKNFQQKRLMAVDTIELIVQCAVQIVLAWRGWGVWSLVYGTLACSASRSLLLWWLAPIKVGRFDIRVAREMFHFGKHMTASTFLIWLIKNMDYYFVGTFLGATALGFYTLAFKLSDLIATNVIRQFGSVLFPAFAEIGTNYDRVRQAWLRAVRYSMILVLPMGVGIIVFSREIVVRFFGEKCEIVIVPMAILTIFALCRGLGVPLGDLAKGIGKPAILTRVAFWHLVIEAPLLFLATFFLRHDERMALIGVAATVSGTTVLAVLLSLWLTSRVVNFTGRQVLASLWPSIEAGIYMAIAGWAGKEVVFAFYPSAPLLAVILVMGSLATAVYGLTFLLRFPSVTADLKGMLARRKEEGALRRPKARAAP